MSWIGPGCIDFVDVWMDAAARGPRLRIEDVVGNVVVPGVYDPTFWTCSLHFTSSIGVRTYDVHAPEIPPATTRPAIDRLLDVDDWKSCDDLNTSWARLYTKKSVAFSAIAPRRGGDSPCC